MIVRLDLQDPDTLSALYGVQRAAYRIEAAIIEAPLPVLEESMSDLRGRGVTFLGEYADGLLRGAIGYAREGDLLDIDRLVVTPAAHRQGVASALLEALAEHEPDATVTTVTAATANAPARSLYARHGFREIGQKVAPGGVPIVELRRP